MGEAKRRAARQQKDRLARKLPANFDLLHDAELQIRGRSITAIESDPEMMDHFELMEATMDTLNLFSKRTPNNLDQETVQLLGARIFNDLASASGKLMRGYYQIAAAIQRDVMEIVFLLDMFLRDRSKIKQWRESDRKTRREEFEPVKVRQFLDTLDGFTERKREKAYKMFCEYAAHPTYAGFGLMGPKGGQPAIGPFFDVPLMKAVLVELAQLAAQAGSKFAMFFKVGNDIGGLKTNLHRMETTALWMERYFGLKADRKGIREIKKLLAQLEAGQT